MVTGVLRNLEIKIDDNNYSVSVVKKGNKNTYIRVKDDLTILVTTHRLTSQNQIIDLLKRNEDYLRKMLTKKTQQQQKSGAFYYLGKEYDIIIVPTMNKIDVEETKIFVSSFDYLNKWYRKQMIQLFNERLETKYHMFDEQIPYPILKIRKMKTRWGVCNRKNISITLNAELIKLDITKMDYVIIHELSHLVHFNHSADFWKLVSKYCPGYKEIRKSMKE